MALALLRPPFAGGQKIGKPGVSGLIGWPNEQTGGVSQMQPYARDVAHAQLFGFDMAADNPGKRVAVGDRKGGKPQLLGAHRQFLWVRGAAQKREIGGDVQLGIGGHQSKAPCSHQRGGRAASNWPSRNSQSRLPSAVTTA